MAGPGVISIQSFDYRGVPEEFSNTYHFVGSAPSTPADWRSLADDFIAIQRTVFYSDVSIVKILCYEDTDHDAVYSYNLADWGGIVAGNLGTIGTDAAPGDVAAWVRWPTDRNTSAGKPIYLRKYFHNVALQAPPNQDKVLGTQKAAYDYLGEHILEASGDWPGMADLDGSALPGGWLSSTYATTRTLKRRGRRPT